MNRKLCLVIPALLAASCSANVAAPLAGHAGTGGSSSPPGSAGRGGTGGSSATLGIVVLLQDRSTSMRNTLSGGATRWATVVDAVKPVLQQTQAGISWGFKLFPDGKQCGVTTGVNIAPALNNAGAITTALDGIRVE